MEAHECPLLLDECVHGKAGSILEDQGYDVLSPHRPEWQFLKNQDDEDLFAFAASRGRILVTFDVGDFVPIAHRWYERDEPFTGLFVSDEIKDLRTLLRALTTTLKDRSLEAVYNQVTWFSNA